MPFRIKQRDAGVDNEDPPQAYISDKPKICPKKAIPEIHNTIAESIFTMCSTLFPPGY